MRVFVAYGYHERDRWVEDCVLPLIAAFGCEAVHGRVVYGGVLPDEVMKAIRSSDALLGFTTRRESIGEGQYRTHDWVVQELLIAHAQEPQIPWVEIREQGVVSPGGILESANAQRIDYREEDLAGCLVKIAHALRRLREMTEVITVRLGPPGAVDEVSVLLDDPSFVCTWQTLRGVAESAPRRIPVFPIGGRLFVRIRGLAQRELVRIAISVRGRTWRSDYELLDTVAIHIKE